MPPPAGVWAAVAWRASATAGRTPDPPEAQRPAPGGGTAGGGPGWGRVGPGRGTGLGERGERWTARGWSCAGRARGARTAAWRRHDCRPGARWRHRVWRTGPGGGGPGRPRNAQTATLGAPRPPFGSTVRRPYPLLWTPGRMPVPRGTSPTHNGDALSGRGGGNGNRRRGCPVGPSARTRSICGPEMRAVRGPSGPGRALPPRSTWNAQRRGAREGIGGPRGGSPVGAFCRQRPRARPTRCGGRFHVERSRGLARAASDGARAPGRPSTRAAGRRGRGRAPTFRRPPSPGPGPQHPGAPRPPTASRRVFTRPRRRVPVPRGTPADAAGRGG